MTTSPSQFFFSLFLLSISILLNRSRLQLVSHIFLVDYYRSSSQKNNNIIIVKCSTIGNAVRLSFSIILNSISNCICIRNSIRSDDFSGMPQNEINDEVKLECLISIECQCQNKQTNAKIRWWERTQSSMLILNEFANMWNTFLSRLL